MQRSYSVAILCGGMSRRMGQDKATMLYYGLPMVCHQTEAFSGAQEVLLSVRDEGQKNELTEILQRGTRAGQAHPRITFVIDPVKDAGPVAGITAALKACRTEWLFVVAVDMPEMDAIFADELFSASHTNNKEMPGSRLGEAEQEICAIVPVGPDGQEHPLAAFYRKDAAATFADALKKGQYRVRSIVAEMSSLFVQTDRLADSARKLQNRNTPE